MKEPLDIYEIDMMPPEMKAYLRNYGYSFSQRACEFAVSLMRTKKGEKITPYSDEQVEALLKKYGVELEKNENYNAVYVANMLLADKMKSSIPDEAHLALGIKDVIDDYDASPRLVFKQWVTKMDDEGETIPWLKLL